MAQANPAQWDWLLHGWSDYLGGYDYGGGGSGWPTYSVTGTDYTNPRPPDWLWLYGPYGPGYPPNPGQPGSGAPPPNPEGGGGAPPVDPNAGPAVGVPPETLGLPPLPEMGEDVIPTTPDELDLPPVNAPPIITQGNPDIANPSWPGFDPAVGAVLGGGAAGVMIGADGKPIYTTTGTDFADFPEIPDVSGMPEPGTVDPGATIPTDPDLGDIRLTYNPYPEGTNPGGPGVFQDLSPYPPQPGGGGPEYFPNLPGPQVPAPIIPWWPPEGGGGTPPEKEPEKKPPGGELPPLPKIDAPVGGGAPGPGLMAPVVGDPNPKVSVFGPRPPVPTPQNFSEILSGILMRGPYARS